MSAETPVEHRQGPIDRYSGAEIAECQNFLGLSNYVEYPMHNLLLRKILLPCLLSKE